jgi:hypothetical protein
MNLFGDTATEFSALPKQAKLTRQILAQSVFTSADA